MKIRFARLAQRDLREQIVYLVERNPAAARDLRDRVQRTVTRLAAGEFEGREVTLTTGERVHAWPVPPLLVYYERRADVLFVVRVYHGARRPIAR